MAYHRLLIGPTPAELVTAAQETTRDGRTLALVDATGTFKLVPLAALLS